MTQSITAGMWRHLRITLGDCQEKMDELAGGHVQMTGHTQAVLGSVLNLGITQLFSAKAL